MYNNLNEGHFAIAGFVVLLLLTAGVVTINARIGRGA